MKKVLEEQTLCHQKGWVGEYLKLQWKIPAPFTVLSYVNIEYKTVIKYIQSLIKCCSVVAYTALIARLIFLAVMTVLFGWFCYGCLIYKQSPKIWIYKVLYDFPIKYGPTILINQQHICKIHQSNITFFKLLPLFGSY